MCCAIISHLHVQRFAKIQSIPGKLEVIICQVGFSCQFNMSCLERVSAYLDLVIFTRVVEM